MSAGKTFSRSLRDTLVSVVIPCYNQAHYLRIAIQSALALTYPRVEIIAVDDGSTDNTADVIHSFPSVTYIHQENQDVASARNTGLRASTGEFLIFLDQDDVLLPNAIDDGLRCFEEYPDSGLVFGRYRRIDAAGNIISNPTQPPDEVDFYLALLQRNPIGNPAIVMHRKDALEKVGGFDPSFKASCDYHLYLRIAQDFPVHKHDGIVSEYRTHQGNVSLSYRYMLKNTLRALHTQSSYASQMPAYQSAINTGFATWRAHYGRLMLSDLREHWKTSGMDLGSIERFWNLACTYPEGVVLLTRSILRGFVHRQRPNHAA